MAVTYFFATVINVKDDKEMIGRALIRADSDQDDKGRIPDTELRWARPIMNPHDAPQIGGVGRGGTSLIPGTRVLCMYIDNDKQHPFILGSVGTAGKTNSDGTITPQGTLPDGTKIAAGNPYSGKGVLPFHDNRDMLEGTALERVAGEAIEVFQKLKTFTHQEFFDGDSGNGPPRYGDETNTLASIFPQFHIPDMTAFVRGFNPNNIGGIAASIGSIMSMASSIRGLPEKLLGQVTGSLLKTVSNIVNIGASNFLDAVGGIASNLTNAMEISPIPANALDGIASMPFSPLQRVGYNIATGSINSKDIGSLTNISNGISEIKNSPTGDYNNAAYSNIATSIGTISNQNYKSIQNMALTSEICTQISDIASINGIYEGVYDVDNATPQLQSAVLQIISLARQAGQILGVGDSLLQYSDRPSLLIDRINYYMQSMK